MRTLNAQMSLFRRLVGVGGQAVCRVYGRPLAPGPHASLVAVPTTRLGRLQAIRGAGRGRGLHRRLSPGRAECPPPWNWGQVRYSARGQRWVPQCRGPHFTWPRGSPARLSGIDTLGFCPLMGGDSSPVTLLLGWSGMASGERPPGKCIMEFKTRLGGRTWWRGGDQISQLLGPC